MRDAMNRLGSDSNKINPLIPVDPVIDHLVQVYVTRSENALQSNMELKFQRNKERFYFLKWGSTAFNNMVVVPPGSRIVHQKLILIQEVNLCRRMMKCTGQSWMPTSRNSITRMNH